MKKVLSLITAGTMMLSCCPVLSVNAADAAYKQFYVSSAGSDSNDGSEGNPFATIKKAKEAAALNAEGMTGDIVINIDAGTYQITEPLEFNASDSGRNGYDIVYRGVEGQTVISGGVNVGNFTASSEYSGLYELDLVQNDSEYIKYITVNGKKRNMATSGKLITPLGNYDDPAVEGTYNGMYVNKADVSDIVSIEDVEFVWERGWVQSKAKASAIIDDPDNTNQSIVKFDNATWNAVQTANASATASVTTAQPTISFYMMNDVSLVDEEGEFAVCGNKLYYKSYADEGVGLSAVIPQNETFGIIMGSKTAVNANESVKVENLTFENLTFTDFALDNGYEDYMQSGQGPKYSGMNKTTGAGNRGVIYVDRADSITFKNNTFKNLGQAAINMKNDVSNSIVEGNVFYDLSGSAIEIGERSHIKGSNGGEDSILPAEPKTRFNLMVLQPYVATSENYNSEGAYQTDFLRMQMEKVTTSSVEDATKYNTLTPAGTWKGADGEVSWIKYDFHKPYTITEATLCFDPYEAVASSQPAYEIRLSNDEDFADYVVAAEQTTAPTSEVTSYTFNQTEKYRYMMVCTKETIPMQVSAIFAYTSDMDNQIIRRRCDNISIKNNYITRVAADEHSAVAIFSFSADDLNIMNNEISNIPYSAISTGYSWSAAGLCGNMNIKNNYIHNFSQTLYDGGGIYNLGNQGISEISGNYLSDGAGGVAVYIDNGSSGITVSDNVDEFSRSTVTFNADAVNSSVTSHYSPSGNYENSTECTLADITSYTIGKEPYAVYSIKQAAGLTDAYEAIKAKVPENKKNYFKAESLNSNCPINQHRAPTYYTALTTAVDAAIEADNHAKYPNEVYNAVNAAKLVGEENSGERAEALAAAAEMLNDRQYDLSKNELLDKYGSFADEETVPQNVKTALTNLQNANGNEAIYNAKLALYEALPALNDGSVIVSCNVADATNVTNVGFDSTDLIKIVFSKPMNQDTLTASNIVVTKKGATEAEDTVVTAPVDVVDETTVTIDPMYLSAFTSTDGYTVGDNFPMSGSYTITIGGLTTATGEVVEETTISFETGLIVPVSYKEGKKIVDISEGKELTAFHGSAAGGSNPEYNATDRDSATFIGPKVYVTDANNPSTTRDITVATYVVDLGSVYDIAGMAWYAPTGANSYQGRRMTIGASNVAPDYTTVTGNKVAELDLAGYITPYGNTNIAYPTYQAKFADAASYRYIYGSMSAAQDHYQIAELYVWAYVPYEIAEDITSSNVSNATGVTNVGVDSTDLIEINFAEAVDTETLNNTNIKITDANGAAVAYEPYEITETSYKIDPKYLSTFPTNDGTTIGDFPSGGSYTITINDVKTAADKNVVDTISFETGLIVPVSYKEGKKIVDISEGKELTAFHGSAAGTGNVAFNATDRDSATFIGPKIYDTDSTNAAAGRDNTVATYVLDLGNTYNIAGISWYAPSETGYQKRYMNIGASNVAPDYTTVGNNLVANLGLTPYITANGSNQVCYPKSQAKFTEDDNANYRYIYGSMSAAQDHYQIAELYVWAYTSLATVDIVSSNVTDATGVTNVGFDSTDLIEINFAEAVDSRTLNSANIKITDANGKEVAYEPYEITETSYKIDPKYLSTFTSTDGYTVGDNFPTGGSYTITIDGLTTATGAVVKETTISFETDLIVPVAYQEGRKILDVVASKELTAFHGSAAGGSNPEYNATDRNATTVIGPKCYTSDGAATGRDASVATYVVDLGSAYDIAGIAWYAPEGVSYQGRRMTIGTSNVAPGYTTVASNKVAELDLAGYITPYGDTNIAYPKYQAKFADAASYRYIYGSMSAAQDHYQIAELYVWAYADMAATDIVSSNVEDATNVTNVGFNSTGLIEINFAEAMSTASLNNDNIIITNSKGDVVAYEPYGTPTATSYKIDLKYLSKYIADGTTPQAIPTGDTFTVSISGAVTANGAIINESFSFTTGQIIPVAYAEGYSIIDIAAGKSVNIPNGDIHDAANTTGKSGNMTDGDFKTTVGANYLSKTDAGAAFSLDLGGEYKLAGIVNAGYTWANYASRYYKLGGSVAETADMSAIDTYISTSGDVMISNSEVRAKFYDMADNKTVRYIYGARNGGSNAFVEISELQVYVYAQADSLVSSITPASGTTGITNIGKNTTNNIVITFNQAMNEATLNSGTVIIKGADGAAREYEGVYDSEAMTWTIPVSALATVGTDRAVVGESEFSLEFNGAMSETGIVQGEYDWTVTTAPIVAPVAEKEGKIIMNVAFGRQTTGNVMYDNEVMQLADENDATFQQHRIPTHASAENTNYYFELDLGKAYDDIAGVVIQSGTTRTAGWDNRSTEYYLTTEKAEGALNGTPIITIDKTGIFGGQTLSNFNTEGGRYLYAAVGQTEDPAGALLLGEVYVFAYVDADFAYDNVLSEDIDKITWGVECAFETTPSIIVAKCTLDKPVAGRLMMALYQNGRLVDCWLNAKDTASTEYQTVSVDLSAYEDTEYKATNKYGLKLADGYELKCFFWTNDGNMKPYVKSINL